MQTKKTGYFLTLLLFSGLICSVGASTTTISFRGSGVTIDLAFPEEAHPAESITHNVTITANIALTLQNFTIFIYAPVNAIWQEVKNQTITSWDLLENENLTSRLGFTLPQEANGTLYCFMYVKTSQSVQYSSYTFYTTRVSELTFSEMQSLYQEMLANYTILQANYTTLLNEYDGLLANYSSLFANYTALLSQYNGLSADYNSKIAAYASLLTSYNTLSSDHSTLNSDFTSKLNEYNALQANYDSLNSTHYSLQANYTSLQTDYDALNQTYIDLLINLDDLEGIISDSERKLNTDGIVMFIFVVIVACLIAFIIYLKRKKTEPYVVIRKETVAMKPDEKT